MTAPATTTGGGLRAASGGRSYLGLSELYLPMFGLGRCDLCGFETPERELSRITLEPGHKIEIETYAGKRPRWRSPRVAYVCRRHRGEDAVGVPITTPNLTMAPGTSRLRPQPSALFDDTGLKRGGRR